MQQKGLEMISHQKFRGKHCLPTHHSFDEREVPHKISQLGLNLASLAISQSRLLKVSGAYVALDELG